MDDDDETSRTQYHNTNPNWQPEQRVDQGVTTLIDKYLEVKNDTVLLGIGCVRTVMDILKKWAEKEQQPE